MSNKLSESTSPYLLQHKDNPVHWYPWCEEAFERAKKEDKPIFLSIGYSTCHWCHVMAHESFEDEGIALLLNEDFISIKLDREERPDLDQLYMTVCQVMNGSGGWPLTVFLTPEKQAFFAGTYFPKASIAKRPGMFDLLPYIIKIWKEDRPTLMQEAQKVMAYLIQSSQKLTQTEVGDEHIEAALNQFSETYDNENAGFGRAPKFPSPHQLMFLLAAGTLNDEPKHIKQAEETLLAMRCGGMFDHIGFGFHRYSTDAEWKLPHFEKMLIDQATCILGYTTAYDVTQNETYKDVVYEIVEYLEKSMAMSKGGYYSAENADSEGEEGKFYTWTMAEIESCLTDDEFLAVSEHYSIEVDGNFEDESTGELTGTNIFYTFTHEKIENWDKIRKKLYQERDIRIKPSCDDKVLTDWNAWIVAALAQAADCFDDKKLLKRAIKCITFLEKNCSKNGQWMHVYRKGKVNIEASGYDVAALIYAYLNLYEATFETVYLDKAVQLNELMMNELWDKKNGGFYSSNAADVLVKQKDFHDGAMPSVNALAFYNLTRLSQLLMNNELRLKARELISVFSENINSYPAGFSFWLFSLLSHTNGVPTCVIICMDTKDVNIKECKKFLPYGCVIHPVSTKTASTYLKPLLSKGYTLLNNQTTFYVCEDFNCKTPVNDLSHL